MRDTLTCPSNSMSESINNHVNSMSDEGWGERVIEPASVREENGFSSFKLMFTFMKKSHQKL